MKLTLYVYFQIPSEINQPWQTPAIQRKAYPKEWDQNKATINRKKPSSIQSNHWEKVGFALALQTDNRLTTPSFSAADTTSFSDRSHLLKAIHAIQWWHNSRVTNYCHSHAKCKWCYNMGRDWVVLIIKLWMNLTKHTLHTHAFGQKSIGFFVRLNF